jgi:hypothetical protein
MNIVTIQRGNPYSATITLTTSTGAAYDLTGKIVLFALKKVNDFTTDITDATALIIATTTHTAPFTSGVTVLDLTAVQTAIPAGEYKCDFRVYQAGVVQANSDIFKVIITDIVTRRTA